MAPNYGAVAENASSTQSRTRQRRSDDGETESLLSKSHEDVSTTQKFKTYMRQDVNRAHGYLILLFCYIITGLLDSSSILIWGSFVSMQTGNTIYLGLGIANPSAGTRWIKSLISISFFCFGSFCFSRYHNYFSPTRRWVLVVSYLVQMLLIITAAVFVTIDKKTDSNLHPHITVPLALVAFQSSGQAVSSRALKFIPLTSVVLTSIYCDLFSDKNLLAGLTENAERNQRFAAPICLLIGTILGGLWAQTELGLAGALWTAAGLKLVIVVAWMLWQKNPEED